MKLSDRKSLSTNAIFNVAYQLLNVLFPLVTSMYISRVLLPSGVGNIAFAQNIASYFVLIASLGIPAYGVREIARASNERNRSRIFSELFVLNGFMTLAASILYLLLCLTCFSDSELALHLIFGLLILLNMFNFDWLYQGMENYVFIAVRNAATKFIAFMAMFIFVKQVGDINVYAVILCLGTAGNYLLNVIKAGKYVSFSFIGIRPLRHLKAIAVIFAASIASELYARIDITMLGALGLSDATGFYSNGQKIVMIALQLLVAVTTVFLPRLSRLYQEDRSSFAELINKGTRILLVVGIPLFVGLNLVAEEGIAVLFGEAFLPSAATVHILSPMLLIKGVGDLLCYQALLAMGLERWFIPSRMIGVAVNLSLNALLIPAHAEIGAAFASATSEFLLNLPLLIVCCKRVKIRPGAHFVSTTILATFVMTIVIICVQHSGLPLVVSFLLSLIVGVAVYGIALVLLRNGVAVRIMSVVSSKYRKEH